MFKLVLFCTVIVAAAAYPGFLGSSDVFYAVPSTVTVHEPALAHVGSVVKSIPTAVSHQSQSVVHNTAHVVEDVVAPAVKTTVTKTVAAAGPHVVHTYSAPLISQQYVKTYGTPVVYKSW